VDFARESTIRVISRTAMPLTEEDRKRRAKLLEKLKAGQVVIPRPDISQRGQRHRSAYLKEIIREVKRRYRELPVESRWD